MSTNHHTITAKIAATTLAAMLLTASLAGCGNTVEGERTTHDGGAAGTTTAAITTRPQTPPVEADPHVHQLGDWAITAEMSCTQNRLLECSCACGYVEKAVVPTEGHQMKDGVCTECGRTESQGLRCVEVEGGYELAGIGACKDQVNLIVPAYHNGKPVVGLADDLFALTEMRLNSITLPETLIYIGKNVLSQCFDMTYVVIPDGVIRIGEGAFNGCAELQSVSLSASVAEIGVDAFGGCYNLRSITVDESNPTYFAAGNCLIKRSTKTLVQGCHGSVIPDDGSVNVIGENAFSFDGVIEQLTVPGSILSISAEAFMISDVQSVKISDGVRSIGTKAFWHCRELRTVTLPASLEKIESEAFFYCKSLEYMIYEGTMEQWYRMEVAYDWAANGSEFTVYCTDGSFTVNNY